MERILIAGGVYHLAWALFDSCWPHLFAWKRTLANLDDINRSLLYILSRLLVLLYLFIAVVSLFCPQQLLKAEIGQSLLVFVAVYWAFRAVMQMQFFGLERANRMNITLGQMNFSGPFGRLSNRAASTIFLAIFLLGISLYLVPVLV